MLRFTVPGLVRGKGRPRFVATPRGGRTYTDAQTASYENLVKMCAKAAGARIIEGPIEMHIAVFMHVPQSISKKRRQAMLDGIEVPTKKPDLSNILKAIEDALNGIAYPDDCNIVALSMTKHYAVEPRVDVTVGPAASSIERAA